MPNSNAVWRVDWSSSLFCWPPGTYSKYQYTIDTDTIIGITTYKKIYKSGMQDMCGTAGNYFYNYAGGMREDTINKKVYFICPNYLTDTLLYDFAVNIGDTIHTVWCTFGGPNGYTQNVIVSTIDSVLVGSNYHKRFNTNNFFAFIEGIGNSTGLLEPIDIGQNDSWQLTCFTHITDIYPSTSTSCQLISVGLIEQEKDESYNLLIYPNPFSLETIFKSDKNIKNATLTIYNAFGQEMKIVKNISGQTIKLQRDNLQNGIYFIRVTQDNKVIATDKLIITD